MINSAIPIRPAGSHVRELPLADGASLRVIDEETAELHDSQGRLLLRYRDGALELSPASGDLVLKAPNGRVVVDAADDVAVRAGGTLEVTSEQTHIVSGAVTVAIRQLDATADTITQRVERYQLDADRIVERTRDSFREVRDLAQQRVGRLRTLVSDLCSIDARRTTIRSEEDTSIDGKRVLLG
jgi:Protein of unknown function (DUF3540)